MVENSPNGSEEHIPVNEDGNGVANGENGDEFSLPVDEHFEEVSEGGKKVRQRGVYLLPNLLTTAALFSGFYAIIAGMNRDFGNAAIAMFFAGVFDGLDGRVARMTNTQSAFGVEYDSLSDMVSFGLAPALVMFSWSLDLLGKFGWAVAFAYAACAALRLARFNTQVGTVDKRYFIGLSSPAAAGLIAGTVWVGADTVVSTELAIVSAVLTLAAALLMVSNIKYYSFKNIDFRGRVPFVAILAVVMIFVIVSSSPAIMLLVVALVYGSAGPAMWVWRRTRGQASSNKN